MSKYLIRLQFIFICGVREGANSIVFQVECQIYVSVYILSKESFPHWIIIYHKLSYIRESVSQQFVPTSSYLFLSQHYIV